FLVFAFVVILASACAKSETTTAPVPTPPGNTSGGPFPDSTVLTNTGVPDLSRAVTINLQDKVNYSAIYDLVSDFAPPLVADPLISLSLTKTGTQVAGSILFAIEDDLGLAGGVVPSFGATGRYQSNVLDV